MNPYIIGPYNESDRGKFYGRTKEIEGLYRSFLLHDYLVCYANSGEGKSSILKAGLFPKLRSNEYFPIDIRFNFDEKDADIVNFDKIINAAIDEVLSSDKEKFVSFEAPSLINDTEDKDEIRWQKQLIYDNVWLRLRYSELKIKNKEGEIVNYTPVLVFDQFEEVFTNPKSEKWTKNFFHWLEKLSRDSCPSEILDKLHERIDESDFPIINSLKKFKAIFSFRSEYVGNVDYWGLQHYYIPDLKNNRYFLKPLTPEGAKEVIMQPNGIDITPEECEELVRGCSDNVDYVREKMPCVPASVLSIVCHELYEHTEQQRTVTLKSLHNDKNATIESILENYYLKLLKKSGITDEKIRDAFENALVDDRGNRKRIETNHKDFSLITEEQIKKLKDNNLLRVISSASNKLGEVVELPHDKFCGFIMNHKNKRFAEIQDRNKSLKEWLLLGVLGIILGVTACYIHYIFIDAIKPFISGCRDFCRSKEGVNQLLSFMNYLSLNIERYEIPLIICIIQSVILLPCSILCIARQRKRTAMGLSLSVALTSVWLLNKTNNNVLDGNIGSFALFSLILSVGIILYTTIKWRNIEKNDISSWPLWGCWFLFFCYLFWECLRSLKMGGVSVPGDSFCFVVILPLLLLLWTFTYFKIKIPSKGIFKSWHRVEIQMFLIVCLLSSLAINNVLEYDCNFDKLTVCIILVFTIGIIIYFLWSIKSICKRIIAITINIIVLIIVYILNLGYNPLKVNYNNVSQVFSWRTVIVRDATSKLFGLSDPINGDTIMPCVMSYDEKNNRFKHSSLKFEDNPILNDFLANRDSSFRWDKGVAEGYFKHIPTLEEHIKDVENDYDIKKDTLLSSHIDYYSTQLYKEIRNACLEYIINAKTYSFKDIKSFEILDSLQNKALEEELKKWNTSIKDTRMNNRDRIDVIEDDDIHRLLSIITKNLYLYVLKDRILQKDFPSIFTLESYYHILYFSSVQGVILNYNFSGNYNVLDDDSKYETSIRLSVCNDDVINKKCFAWYNLFIELCSLDFYYNSQSFKNKLQDQYSLAEIEKFGKSMSNYVDRLQSLNNRSEILLKELKQNKNTMLGIKSLLALLGDQKMIKDDIKESMSDLTLTAGECETIYKDIAFYKYSKGILDVFFNILEKKPCNIYNGVFENICMYLITTRYLRGYNIAEEHERLVKIKKNHDGFYDRLMGITPKMSESLEKVNGLLRQITNML